MNIELDPKDPGFGKFSPDSGASKVDLAFYNFTAADYERKFTIKS